MITTFNNPDGVAPPAGQYSHVARVELGEVVLLFIAGQVALGPDGSLVGPGDAAAQAVQINENLKTILAAHGGTLRDIVKLTTFITNMDDRAKMVDARRDYFPESPPTSTLVEVSRLASPDWLVETEAVAVVKRA